jgi:hypothetical protein
MTVRYVKDQIQQRYLAVVVEGRDLLLVDVECPTSPPYAISSAFLRSEERFVEHPVHEPPAGT